MADADLLINPISETEIQSIKNTRSTRFTGNNPNLTLMATDPKYLFLDHDERSVLGVVHEPQNQDARAKTRQDNQARISC